MTEEEPRPCPGSCDRAGSPVWCQPCSRLVRASLNDIDRLVTWLENQDDGYGSRSPGTYVAGGDGGPRSASSTADLLDQVYSDLVRAEAAWRRLQGYSSTRRSSTGRTAHDRSVTLAFLQKNLTSALLSPEMGSHFRKITRWRIVLQHLAHAEPERLNRPGRCPRCHLVNVLHTNPDTRMIECRACPMDMTEEEYEREVTERPDPLVVAESKRELGLSEA